MSRNNQTNIHNDITDPNELELSTIKCSNCLKIIGEYAVINKEFPVLTKVRVKCAYCNDYSYIVEICGKYYIGPENNLVYTETEYVDNVFIFISKIKDN